jgi:hypothetical protein
MDGDRGPSVGSLGVAAESQNGLELRTHSFARRSEERRAEVDCVCGSAVRRQPLTTGCGT